MTSRSATNFAHSSVKSEHGKGIIALGVRERCGWEVVGSKLAFAMITIVGRWGLIATRRRSFGACEKLPHVLMLSCSQALT